MPTIFSDIVCLFSNSQTLLKDPDLSAQTYYRQTSVQGIRSPKAAEAMPPQSPRILTAAQRKAGAAVSETGPLAGCRTDIRSPGTAHPAMPRSWTNAGEREG